MKPTRRTESTFGYLGKKIILNQKKLKNNWNEQGRRRNPKWLSKKTMIGMVCSQKRKKKKKGKW